MSLIIDRRLNDRNKSEANRQRFLRRYRRHIRKSVDKLVRDRSIKDMESGGQVSIRRRDMSEPGWRHGSGGQRDIVLPGNREFNQGDKLDRPPSGAEADGDGLGEDSEDDFTFALSRDEFMSIFFDDLELPNLLRTETGSIHELKPQRAGFVTEGNQANLDVVRSMKQAMARRIALSGSARRRLKELEQQTDENLTKKSYQQPESDISTQPVDENGQQSEDKPSNLELEREELRQRIARVPFIDTIDLRYRHRVFVPKPMSQAVMFCLMDVSASMDEHCKDLAKRFFTLLYMFLARKYEHVEVVFIRHTSEAEEVDENRFFNDRATGGTIVLPALQLLSEIIAERFPPHAWNLYGAQASDGDAFGADPEKSRNWLETQIMPLVRFYAYLEVGNTESSQVSTLAGVYQRIEQDNFAMNRAVRRSEIYPVFREFFQQRTEAANR
ncbi:MAG: YeaH/YhbH family protein [Granulosicoccus sp.]|nr:YeaH/YhbH family protein [Granulosicoccus sp.]